ncbi:sensor histidine kinase [Roseovarius amoyensis]|uniref:sensor histidine kinase n=1 Tax=Roseovarius amoyensis TaxID=2211448 RepID=UPI000DBE1F64|nr:HAMP domain-containing sensor histidine kinase [Roseovarius amoyensis]
MRFLKSLSGRFLVLTAVFVMLAEVLIFVPSVARFREDFLMSRLERAQIAALALLANEDISAELQEELLLNAGVFNIVLRRDAARQLVLSSPLPQPVSATFDLRNASALVLIRDALARLTDPEPQVIRVIGVPSRMAGLLIEITLETEPLRMAMLDYGFRILMLSLVISVITAGLLYLAVRALLVRPISRVVGHMQSYAAAPEDARRVIVPSAGVTELREAEEALKSLQTQLTGALKQRERLAQLGGAVARVSHDLRNILTTAQLFTDRIETSDDPKVQRMAPKLVGSISRAVHLCESTLAFGRAEEPAARLERFALAPLVEEVIESERMAIEAEADIQFASDIPDGQNVRADREQLYRVLTNLLRNARQAIADAGKSGAIDVSARESNGTCIITVADTGPGLPPKARENLFRPFQGAASRGGSGLGLSIAQELVRGHGGDLTLERSNATGTVFSICLPAGE